MASSKRMISVPLRCALVLCVLSPVNAILCSEHKAFAQTEGIVREEGGETTRDAGPVKRGEDEAPVPVIPPGTGKEEKRDAVPPAQPLRKPENAPVRPPAPALKEPAAGDGLLEITEGAFKYRRIPGINLKKMGDDVLVPAPAPADRGPGKKSPAGKPSGKGLFGMTRGATDVLAKAVLIGIIAVIFVLYRYRTRGSRSSVLRRFPKTKT